MKTHVIIFNIIYCLLISYLAPIEGRVESLDIYRDDRRFFHIESFGYEQGFFSFELSDFELYTLAPEAYVNKVSGDAFNIAFVLQRSDQDALTRNDENIRPCFHTDMKNDDDTTVWSIPARNKWNETTKYSKDIERSGYYHLYFSNCEENSQTSFTLYLVEYNLDGDVANYLSAGESSLPFLYFFICAMFITSLVIWCQQLYRYKSEIKNIHYLMTVLLVLKIFTLFFESFEYHNLKIYGTAHGWNIAYYIFTFLKSMMLFSVIVLIGTGWSYLKPFLTERDKQIVWTVLVVQLMVNIAMVVTAETSPGSRDWLTWRDILHLLDMICCCAILLPIVWSIRHLREAASADGKAARTIERLKRFRRFYLLVVSYIYFTRIIVFLLQATLSFEFTWLGNVFDELAALIFYVTTGYLFKPRSDNPYLALEDVGDHTYTANTVAELSDL